MDPDPTPNSQSVIEETPGRNLMATLLAIPHSVTPDQGTHFTKKHGRNHGGYWLWDGKFMLS